MVSRTLRTSLTLASLFALATTSTACSDDATTEDSTTTFTTNGDEIGTDTMMDGMEGMDSQDTTTDADTSTTDPDTSTTDPDTSTTDPTTTDTTTSTTGDTTTGPPACLDLDQDGYGENCEMGPDCDDADYNNHTEEGCMNCMDADGDGQWVGCDIFDDAKPGEDCDDNDYNVFTEEGCMNCVDVDMDNVWVGCDQYGDMKPGPDCDDDNDVVGLEDGQEICNGLSENCAGEIDNAPPDEMCPPDGVDAPNVAVMNGWLCNPPAPGEDGCEINQCVEQFFDLDGQVPNGCECAGTPRTDSLAECSNFPQGELGSVAEGEQLNNLITGTIPEIDNGIGSGAEDWYWVEFPENDAVGTRPETGSIQISFAQNDGNDYRFEVFRTCNGVAFDMGLATAYGVGAPPTLSWWFFDNHAEPLDMPVPAQYVNNVTWPNTVYIRVFRVQNDLTCNNYKLAIQRVANGD